MSIFGGVVPYAAHRCMSTRVSSGRVYARRVYDEVDVKPHATKHTKGHDMVQCASIASNPGVCVCDAEIQKPMFFVLQATKVGKKA